MEHWEGRPRRDGFRWLRCTRQDEAITLDCRDYVGAPTTKVYIKTMCYLYLPCTKVTVAASSGLRSCRELFISLSKSQRGSERYHVIILTHGDAKWHLSGAISCDLNENIHGKFVAARIIQSPKSLCSNVAIRIPESRRR